MSTDLFSVRKIEDLMGGGGEGVIILIGSCISLTYTNSHFYTLYLEQYINSNVILTDGELVYRYLWLYYTSIPIYIKVG